MMARRFTRRAFLQGCSAAIAAMAGSRLGQLAFAIGHQNPEVLVVIFLRGGWDALNVVPPIAVSADRGFYEQARPTLRIPSSGAGAALPLDSFFGLHPALAPLHALYQAQRLAIVHACGLTHDTRSHFDAMAYMELGTPGAKSTPTGWLTRYLQTLVAPGQETPFTALATGASRPQSLLSFPNALVTGSLSSFGIGGNSRYRGQQLNALRAMYDDANDWLEAAGREAIRAIDTIQQQSFSPYVPANGAVYPNTSFGNHLRLIAQLIKAQVGLCAATVDLGGWDTHRSQGATALNSPMPALLAQLAQGLYAFHLDLEGCAGSTDHNSRVTTVVMSEFGRRLRENESGGTDHGHGSVMFVLGKTVRGGQVYGQWPGLSNGALYQGADLSITTDYRCVLSEILTVRMGRTPTQLGVIFPAYAQQPYLGLMRQPEEPVGARCPNFLYLPTVRR